jgi:hypothetical protein
MSEQETKNRLPKSTRITSGGARFLGHPQLATIGLQSTRIARIQSGGGGGVELVLKSETAMGGRAGRRMDGCSAHLATARPRTDGRTDGRSERDRRLRGRRQDQSFARFGRLCCCCCCCCVCSSGMEGWGRMRCGDDEERRLLLYQAEAEQG